MAESGKRQRRLSDGYSFAGFGAKETVRGVFGDPDVRIVRLDRRSKKRFAAVVSGSATAGTTGGGGRGAPPFAPKFRFVLEPERGRARRAPPGPRNANGWDCCCARPP